MLQAWMLRDGVLELILGNWERERDSGTGAGNGSGKWEREMGTGNGKWEREQDFGEREMG